MCLVYGYFGGNFKVKEVGIVGRNEWKGRRIWFWKLV